jgi:hypothetical protein
VAVAGGDAILRVVTSDGSPFANCGRRRFLAAHHRQFASGHRPVEMAGAAKKTCDGSTVCYHFNIISYLVDIFGIISCFKAILCDLYVSDK